MRKSKEGKDRIYSIRNVNAVGDTLSTDATVDPASTPAANPIACLACSESVLVVALTSGTVMKFSLSNLALKSKHDTPISAVKLALNSDASMLSLLDANGQLRILELEKKLDLPEGRSTHAASLTGLEGSLTDFERKDVSDMVWSSEIPNEFATIEKTKLFIYHDFEPEDPVQSFACSLSN
jgi:WD repeat-containing protein 35